MTRAELVADCRAESGILNACNNIDYWKLFGFGSSSSGRYMSKVHSNTFLESRAFTHGLRKIKTGWLRMQCIVRTAQSS